MGKILNIIGVIFLVILAIILGLFIYFYNFHVFTTLTICVSDEIEKEGTSCETDSECIDRFLSETIEESMPDFLSEKISEASQKVVFCEGVCKQRKIYGNFIGEESENFAGCENGDEEISLKIRGKEGIKLFNYLKNKERS